MNIKFIEKLRKILGPDQVLDSAGMRLLYSFDGAVDRGLPDVVVLPQCTADVQKAVQLASQYKIPVTARGAGTGLCGSTVPVKRGMVMHFSRMNKILDIQAEQHTAWVEPGVINSHLQKALEPHGLFYAPDPSSQKACTLGGNVGTNAGGPHCLKYGVTSNHVKALEMVLYDGELVRTSVDDPGYDMTGLFVGSEGTLGLITKIQVGLLPVPTEIRTLLVSFGSIGTAVQSVTDIVSAGIVPTTLEFIDRVTVQATEAFVHAGYPQDAEAVLLIEVDDLWHMAKRNVVEAGHAQPVQKLQQEINAIREICQKNGCQEYREAKDEQEREKLWQGRKGAYPAMARLMPNVLVEDGVVPRTRLPEAVKQIRAIAARENIRMGLIGHLGDGNLHPNMIFDERYPAQTKRVKAAGYEMMRVCVDLGGSLSGEHGIGLDKREAMKWVFSAETLDVFQRIKEALDPGHLFNAGKILPERKVDRNWPAKKAWRTKLAPFGREIDPAKSRPDEIDGADSKWSVRAGLAPARSGQVIQIRNIAHLQSLCQEAAEKKETLFLKGKGTKGFVVPDGARVLVLDGLNKIVDHDKDNFTLTVQAGATLGDLDKVLKPANQFVCVRGVGTLGGILSTRSSLLPDLRDQVIGLKAVLANGDVVEFGGKVVKNVAGYDAAKLFLGAWGTLGVIVEVTLRLYAKGERDEGRDGEMGRQGDGEKVCFAWANVPLCRKIKRVFDQENVFNPVVFD